MIAAFMSAFIHKQGCKQLWCFAQFGTIWTAFHKNSADKLRATSQSRDCDFFRMLCCKKFRQWIININSLPLRKECPNTEFFLVCIFLYSDWIRRFTEYISVFSPNTGKYRPEKTPCLDTFHGVCLSPNKSPVYSSPANRYPGS